MQRVARIAPVCSGVMAPARESCSRVGPSRRGSTRSEPHSRIDDWLGHLPAEGVRQMCTWERFCTFAREPERRVVDISCRLTVAGVAYEVDAELAGETVVVWWGLFDRELYLIF
jgi:hypothetical protein